VQHLAAKLNPTAELYDSEARAESLELAPLDYWYIACRSRELTVAPISRELLGKVLV
jgi:hypothetical protein